MVEDEQIVALDIRVHLQRLGYTVGGSFAAAEDVLEALRARAAAGTSPDLVLMDIHLQGEMDGVTAAGIIREEFQLPVILLTAYADEETLDRAKISEPFAYIIKPFEARELRTAVVLALYRNRMEREIRSREGLLSGVLASIDSGVLVSDRDGAIRYANGIAKQILRATDDAGIDSLIPEDIRRAAVNSPGPVRWSPRMREDTVVELSVSVLEERSTSLGGATVWVLRDITERIRNESALRQKDQQLAHAQRMDAVGRMSGGLAHDFNNLVTVIMGYTRLVLDDLAEHPDLGEILRNVDGIYQTARRSAQLTRQLLTFSRVQHLNAERIQPDRVLSENRTMIEGLMPEYVSLHLHRRAGDAAIRIDRTRFEQVVLNLLLNARDAMRHGGEITLSSEVIHLERPLATLTRTIEPGAYLVLRVTDTGEGISPEHLPHVFEPFFTTKESENGSGFGLATVYSAVDESGGAIDVASTVGHGTTFAVYLPCVDPVEPSADRPGGPEIEESGSGAILVVQEEEAMRTLMARVLRSRGYTPLLARSVGDGLLMLERNAETRLVISDLSAPFLSGAEIVRRYREVLDVAVVLVLTGEQLEAGQAASLMKPFEPAELLQVVRRTIDST